MKKIICGILASVLFLCSCGNEPETKESSVDAQSKTISLFAMDTYMTLKAYGKEAEIALEKSSEEIERLQNLFNINDSESDVSIINSHAGQEPVAVSEDTASVIKTACEVSYETDGALDISVYPVLKEWGFTTENYKIPSQREIDVLLESIDYKKIELNDNSIAMADHMQLDLGSVGKGYTGDKIMEILQNEGITSAMINLGGNVQTLGTKPDGKKWRIGIEDPDNTDNTVCKIDVNDCAVITSGNYQRFFVGEDGKKYWHILDPKTGYPADNGIVSATVIGTSGAECDALSTALFVMGTEKAINYAKTHPNIDVILITSDRKLYITDGIYADAEIQLSNYEIIKRN